MAKAILFDLDGTLVRSDVFTNPANRRAYEEFGLPAVSDEVLVGSIGGTFEDNWQMIMPDRSREEFLAYCERVREIIWADYLHLACEYPRMGETLDLLRARGYQIVLCSNGQKSYYLNVLRQAGLLDRIDHLAERVPGQDKVALVASVLETLKPEKAVMVGDRFYDAQAARGNSIPFIGCGYGLFPNEIVENCPDIEIQSPYELLEAVDKLLGV